MISLRLDFENDAFFLANVRTDLPTSQGKGQPIVQCFNYWFTPLFIEAGSKHDVSGGDAWNSLTEIIRFLTALLTVTSQIALILNLSRSTGGPIFAMVCIIKPMVDTVFARDLWDKSAFCSTLSNLQASWRFIISPVHSLVWIRR